MKCQPRRVLWTFAAIAIALGVAFIPLRSLNCPAWDVWVTDQSSNPVPGATVRISFQNYSAERESHEMDAITDGQGHPKFSAQTLRASLGRRVVAILSSATAGVHASFGPHASVDAFFDGLQSFAVDEQRNAVLDWTGKPGRMESRIVVSPTKSVRPAH